MGLHVYECVVYDNDWADAVDSRTALNHSRMFVYISLHAKI